MDYRTAGETTILNESKKCALDVFWLTVMYGDSCVYRMWQVRQAFACVQSLKHGNKVTRSSYVKSGLHFHLNLYPTNLTLTLPRAFTAVLE